MKAIEIRTPGGPEVLRITDWPDPQAAEGEILVAVAATALNRADTLQRKGLYPVPPGASPIPGLEMAGTVTGLGAGVSKWKIGDRVCGLLSGGGYATKVVIHQDLALPVFEGMSFQQAAAIPEVFLTAYQALQLLADTRAGERVLIHAGASGVGTAAIQLAKMMGCEVFITASAGKHEICSQLGADHLIDYQSEDFADRIAAQTKGAGVDVILDFIGAPYFKGNLNALTTDGRLIILAFMGGGKADEADLAMILRKRLHIIGTTLRSRTLDYKIRLNEAFRKDCWTAFREGRLRPVIDSVYPWTEVAKAHQHMEANRNRGKIVLTVSDPG